MAVTLKDIAEKTGVSIGTVDRALNNRGRINPAVAEKIRRVAEELNYRPNSVAKSLSIRSRKLKIAVVLHIQHNDYFDAIEEGIRRAERDMADLGIEVLFFRGAEFGVPEQLRQIDLALRSGAAALIVVPIDDDKIRRRIAELHDGGVPVVFLANFLENAPVFAAVRCDYARSGIVAAGLMRILSKDPGDVLVFSNSLSMLGHRQRVAAFTEQLPKSRPGITVRKVIELPISEPDSRRIVQAALREHPCRHILYSGNATAGIAAIRASGLETVSIFYDISPVSRRALRDGLIDAVIYQNPHWQGYRAVEILFEYLTADKRPTFNPEMNDCSILLRESL